MRRNMRRHGFRVGAALAIGLVLGLALGWSAAPERTPRLFARTADRWEDRIVATGTLSFEKNKQGMQVTQDAVYYLNYNAGLLLAAVPSYHQTPAGIEVLSEFAERDLVRDFAIRPGSRPHFLMTTASLGARGEGWSALIVFETESGQVATYRVVPPTLSTPGRARPELQLLERRTDPRLAKAVVAASAER